MGVKFTTLITRCTRCTPFKSDSDEENVEFYLTKSKQQMIKQNNCTKTAATKYSMPIPSIIIPPPIIINPTISQLLATLTPTYSKAMNSIISIIDPESDTININYNPNAVMHISSDISPLSTQNIPESSPILMIDNVSTSYLINNPMDTPNNIQRNECDSDHTNSDSENSISIDCIDDKINDFSDWCHEQFSECSEESFVKID